MANDKDPLLGALGICRKAGKLLHGYDRVEEAVMRGKACLVLLACDASKRTTQHMQDTCRGKARTCACLRQRLLPYLRLRTNTLHTCVQATSKSK